jgi:xanthine dehydrogenase YagT iron-sulfur-binding subunit
VPPNAPSTVPLTLRLNGRDRTFLIEPEVTLLDLIRERAGLPGTKKGCDRGQCGACTVLVNDRRVLACLALALAHAGDRVQTIEGLAEDGTLHPMQAAFIEHDALQCGYCTPGQILSAVGALREGRVGDDDAIREAMSGNICRCGAYVNIVAAVRAVREAAL